MFGQELSKHPTILTYVSQIVLISNLSLDLTTKPLQKEPGIYFMLSLYMQFLTDKKVSP